MLPTDEETAALRAIIRIVSPVQAQYASAPAPVRLVKLSLMHEFRLDRWKLDEFLFGLQHALTDSQTYPFYFSKCGAYAANRLHYISTAKRYEASTFSNSYCYISIDKRNQWVKRILGNQ